MTWLILSRWACTESDMCAEGDVRSGDSCVPYLASDPVPYPGDVSIPKGASWQWQIRGSQRDATRT